MARKDELAQARKLLGGTRRMLAVGAIAVVAALGWQADGCNEQNTPSTDAGIADPNPPSGPEASATKHCKGRYTRLKNYRHEVVTVFDPVTLAHKEYPIYTTGADFAWCWYQGGRVYWRDGQIKNDGLLSGVAVSTDWWGQSFCQIPKASGGCYSFLYRTESHAVIGTTLSLLGQTIHLSATQYRCTATAIRASLDDPHNRVIALHACPPSSADVEVAQRRGPLGQLRINGHVVHAPPWLRKRFMEALLTRRNLDYMQSHGGEPLPQVKRLARRLFRSLPASERQSLLHGPKACPALSPDALERLHPGTRCAKRANL